MLNQDVVMTVPVAKAAHQAQGSREQWMIDEGAASSSLPLLKALMADEACAKGVVPTDTWLNKAIAGMLSLYGQAYQQWRANRHDTVGHIFEAALPSGKVIAFGDRRLLAQLAA